MRNIVVRLSSLTLKNIKNVKNGTIIMPLANERKFECSRAEILGIYGQNGSGKTAIVDALYFLQGIITGEELDQRIIDYIDTDSTNAEINAEFNNTDSNGSSRYYEGEMINTFAKMEQSNMKKGG